MWTGKWSRNSSKRRSVDNIYSDLARLNPQAIIVSGFEHAYIGHTIGVLGSPVAVYDYDECIDSILGEGGITDEQAHVFFAFRTLAQCARAHEPPVFVMRRRPH